jgi:hypothetical protein
MRTIAFRIERPAHERLPNTDCAGVVGLIRAAVCTKTSRLDPA